MNIYYLNKKSTIKSPFEITDAHKQKLMKIGDICVRDNVDGVSVWIITSILNNWGSCRCIGKANRELGIEGNTLLYSFDGVNNRRGNLAGLNSLADRFTEGILNSFFKNAIEILQYKCDCWDISVLGQILSLPSVSIVTSQYVEDSTSISFTKHTKFQNFLTGETEELLNSLVSEGHSLRKVYTLIREKYPVQFRKALQSFMKENPGATIYD